jgi:hypothetical protein
MRFQYFIKHRQKTEENEKMLLFCVANFFLDFPVKLDLYFVLPTFFKSSSQEGKFTNWEKIRPVFKGPRSE